MDETWEKIWIQCWSALQNSRLLNYRIFGRCEKTRRARERIYWESGNTIAESSFCCCCLLHWNSQPISIVTKITIAQKRFFFAYIILFLIQTHRNLCLTANEWAHKFPVDYFLYIYCHVFFFLVSLLDMHFECHIFMCGVIRFTLFDDSNFSDSSLIYLLLCTWFLMFMHSFSFHFIVSPNFHLDSFHFLFLLAWQYCI